MTPATDDRLFDLLPPVHRQRDTEQGWPLRSLLQVIAGQADVVESDIDRLYDNWFIETCEDWVVPYLADLVGWRPVHGAGRPAAPTTERGRALNAILVPRREVANTVRYRRRKGTAALLELLARDVAGWPARAVEFFRLLAFSQAADHLRPERGRTTDLRRVDALDLLDGPFDELAHTVDVRRLASRRGQGRYNLPSVGVFVWRLGAYPVTECPGYLLEAVGSHLYTFSILGNDTPLFTRPRAQQPPSAIVGELDVPAPIRRRAFDERTGDYYGVDRSLMIWEGSERVPVAVERIVAADLSDWRYRPRPRTVAVDPVLGRIAFPPGEARRGIWVTYHYGFGADVGGGEYPRSLSWPRDCAPRTPRPDPQVAAGPERPDPQVAAGPARPDPQVAPGVAEPPKPGSAACLVYRVGRGEPFERINHALEQWRSDRPARAIVEVTDSGVYVEQLHIELVDGQRLELRAASGRRPVVRLLDWQTSLPDALSVTGEQGGCLVVDGLLVTGRGVQVAGQLSGLVLRHSTLVPGWIIGSDCEPRRPNEPSLELHRTSACVVVEHSIIGSIQVDQDEVTGDPITIEIRDSILDATSPDREALGAPGWPVAHAVLTVERSTVFGQIHVHAVELAENSIFVGSVHVARRQHGCMRFCSVTRPCRTPRRFACQPDLVEAAARDQVGRGSLPPGDLPAVLEAEAARVRPAFASTRYGTPAYARLSDHCAAEIRRGADDQSQMGVFHHLYEPQREANLRVRLDEYTPAGMEAGIIYAT